MAGDMRRLSLPSLRPRAFAWENLALRPVKVTKGDRKTPQDVEVCHFKGVDHSISAVTACVAPPDHAATIRFRITTATAAAKTPVLQRR
jgi:hypothetical protein